MKVLIAVPCMDQVPSQFAQALATLGKVESTVVAFQIGSLIYNSRNDLATIAIEQGADFIFWLDSDMVFGSDTLVRMMKLYQEGAGDILTGLYFRRVGPFSPVLYKELMLDADGNATYTEFDEIPDEPFEVAGCGFGCVLMPTSIAIDVLAKYGTMFNPIQGTGEDLAFCWRARESGYKIVCDPSIRLGHVGHHVITREFWENYKKIQL